jgi:hypothetical protein
MKKRLSLVFALCAMTGILGATGCGDDGDTKKDTKQGTLLLNPESFDKPLEQGEEVILEASYAPDTTLKISTDAKDCVDIDTKEVSTGKNDKATITLTAMGANCTAEIEVSVKGGDASKTINVTVSDANKPRIKLESTKELDSGDSDFATAVYLNAEGKPVADKAMLVNTSDPACVKASSCDETDADGKCSIVLKAAEVDDECSAIVKAKTDDASATMTVTVINKANTDPTTPVTDDWKISVNPKDIEIDAEDLKEGAKVKVTLTDANGTMQNGYKIAFDTTDASCAYVDPTRTKDGIAEARINAEKPSCSATLTAYPKQNKNKKPSAEFTVTVGDVTSYVLTYNVIFPYKRCNDTDYLAAFISSKSCAELFPDNYDINNIKNEYAASKQLGAAKGELYAVNSDDHDKEDGFYFQPKGCNASDKIIVREGQFEGVDVDPNVVKSVVVYAAHDDESAAGGQSIIGHACQDIKFTTKVVPLTIEPEPYDIRGEYHVTSNFDFTSGLEKSGYQCDKYISYNYKNANGENVEVKNLCIPPVEQFKAGDWVDFIVHFAEEPIATLLEFTWSNSLERLKEIDTGNSTLNGIISGALTSKVFLATAFKFANEWLGGTEPYAEKCKQDPPKKPADDASQTVKDAYEKELSEYTKTCGQTWFKIYRSVSGDISELASNMQFGGTFKITGFNDDEMRITAANTLFDTLEYRWSMNGFEGCETYDTATLNAVCDEQNPNGYLFNGDPTRDKSCRRVVNLKDMNGSPMQGTWSGGSVNESEDSAQSDAMLNISAHPMTFRWASILYSTVFGTVLPEIFDYKRKNAGYACNNSYACDALDDKLYIKALLSRLVFQSVINGYAGFLTTENYEYEENGTTKHVNVKEALGNLTIDWGTNYSCSNFAKAIIEWILAVSAAKGNTTSKDWLLSLEGKQTSSDNTAAKVVGSILPQVFTAICEKNNSFNNKYTLDLLDEFIQTMLSQIQVNTSNGLNFSAKECPLYTFGTDKFQYMGIEDTTTSSKAIPTAKEHFQGEKVSTSRCEWTVSLPKNTTGNLEFKGMFHAFRTDVAEPVCTNE